MIPAARDNPGEAMAATTTAISAWRVSPITEPIKGAIVSTKGMRQGTLAFERR